MRAKNVKTCQSSITKSDSANAKRKCFMESGNCNLGEVHTFLVSKNLH